MCCGLRERSERNQSINQSLYKITVLLFSPFTCFFSLYVLLILLECSCLFGNDNRLECFDSKIYNRRHCQKSAADKNNSFSIHCSRSKYNCVFIKFFDFRTFCSRVIILSLVYIIMSADVICSIVKERGALCRIYSNG